MHTSFPNLLNDELYVKVGSDQRGAPVVQFESRVASVSSQLDLQAVGKVGVALYLTESGPTGGYDRRQSWWQRQWQWRYGRGGGSGCRRVTSANVVSARVGRS